MEVEFRDFNEGDIDDIAQLIADTWHTVLTGDTALLVGKLDLAEFAFRSDYIRVAELNGKVVGVVAAHIKENNPFWQEFFNVAYNELCDVNPKGAQWLIDYYDFETAKNEEMASEVDIPYELTLFIVSEEMQGQGIGKQLLEQVTEQLKNAGATSYFLYTDTKCDWQYYEHHGFKRIAEEHATDEEVRQFGIVEFYIYEKEI